MSLHWRKKFILANLNLIRMPRVLIFGTALLVTAPSYLIAFVPFAFWAGAGVPSKLAFNKQPSSTVFVDTNLATQPKVAVTDSSGRLLSGQTNAITLAAYSDNTCTTSAGGTLGATTNPLNAAGGIATFAGVQYSATETIYLKASTAGLTSACSSAIVVSASGGGAPPTAPIPQKLSVTSPTLGISPAEGMTNTCIPLKITVEDFWGTRAAATSNVTINLAGNGSGTYYSNSGCTSSIVTAQVPQSQSEVTVYFKNTVAETDVLFFEDQTGILGGTYYSISFEGTRLVLSGPQSMLIGAACSAYTLQHLNPDGTTASGTLTITFDGYQAGSGGGASSIHTAASCSGGNKITAPVSVTGSYTFYFKPPGVAASLIFTATPATTPPKTTSLAVAVNSTAATKLVVSGGTTPTKDRCSSAYTVTSQTATSVNAGLNADATVTLSQTANAQFYSDSMCTTPVSSVVIAAGTAQATFYIKDSNLESTTLTAASTGLTSGNLAVTFGNGNPMDVSAGDSHTCVVLSDQTIKCWGKNDYGQLGNGTTTNSSIPITVNGITTATAISAGERHTCALLSDQTIKCWGYNFLGSLGNGTTTDSSTPVSVSGISTATAVSSGAASTCALLSDQTVKCWGGNTYGQLGNGNTTNNSTPVAVSGITTATAVSAGSFHACALLSDQSAKCWGNNISGRLGNNSVTNSSTPVVVSGMTTAIAIAAGYTHTCAILSDQSMMCWGANGSGQLGDGTTTLSKIPIAVNVITTATAIATGISHTCALLSDQSIKCWGSNTYGQLGDGTASGSLTPVTVSAITTATSITTGKGGNHSCALLSDQTIKCWGDNFYGQLGGGNTYSSPPVAISGVTTASSVAAGGKHSCTRLSDQIVKCWGDNNRGQLGTGNYNNSVTPAAASGITTATSVATGEKHSCTLLSNQSIKCWGEGGSGQRGNGTTTTSASPVSVSSISTATAIAAAGGNHTCALLSNQSINCWGANASGQLGNGSGVASFSSPQTVSGITTATSVAAGRAHSCAVLSDQSAKCWGINIYGHLGNNSTTNSNIPVVVSGITTATAIATGGDHTCALLSDQSIKCWGSNTYGQLGNGTTTDSLIPVSVSGITTASAIAAGGSHTCALLSDQSVKCWGSNSSLQLGNGTLNSSYPLSVTGITNASTIATGVDHTCASFSDQSIKCWGNNYGQAGSPISKVPIYVQYIP